MFVRLSFLSILLSLPVLASDSMIKLFNYDANNCEFYVNSVRIETTKHYGVLRVRLASTIKLAPALIGKALSAGVWYSYSENTVNYNDEVVISLKDRSANGGVRTEQELAFDIISSQAPSETRTERSIHHFSYFVDVQNSDGSIDRLWMSNQGQNFSYNTFIQSDFIRTSTPYGTVDYASDSNFIYFQKKSCQAFY